MESELAIEIPLSYTTKPLPHWNTALCQETAHIPNQNRKEATSPGQPGGSMVEHSP